jgi:hypothetical protein
MNNYLEDEDNPVRQYDDKGFYRERPMRKSKVLHKCEYCQQDIPVGSSCMEISGKHMLRFFFYYVCVECLDD